MQEKILITGANGQLGTELVEALSANYGQNAVLASDIIKPKEASAPFVELNILDGKALREIIQRHKVTQVWHLAAILSAKGESDPALAWNVNLNGLITVLEVCRETGVKKVFWPSTIAVFGPQTPGINTPQYTITDPVTVYGISKLAGERWCDYYFLKYGLDVRSLRYPGLISWKTLPGGGTTDYAVEIFHHALDHGFYRCFLSSDRTLPMMYMPDAVRGTLELMATQADRISIHSSYNFAGISFSPEEIAETIRQTIPGFKISYAPDFRDEIAANWPRSIDDKFARLDWGWRPSFSLNEMAHEMLSSLESLRSKAGDPKLLS